MIYRWLVGVALLFAVLPIHPWSMARFELAKET